MVVSTLGLGLWPRLEDFINHKPPQRTQSCYIRIAFDIVDHEIMIKKLRKSEVTCGIPQGSCFGPLLLIIYLNDFEKCFRCSKASVYADYTTVPITSNDVEKILHEAQ